MRLKTTYQFKTKTFLHELVIFNLLKSQSNSCCLKISYTNMKNREISFLNVVSCIVFLKQHSKGRCAISHMTHDMVPAYLPLFIYLLAGR